MGLGPYTGIARAGENIGNAIADARQQKAAQREASNTALYGQVQEMAQNIGRVASEKGYKGPFTSAALRASNIPEFEPYLNQMESNLHAIHSTYAPEEMGSLARFFSGKTKNPHPERTVESALSTTPAPLDPIQIKYQQLYNAAKQSGLDEPGAHRYALLGVNPVDVRDKEFGDWQQFAFNGDPQKPLLARTEKQSGRIIDQHGRDVTEVVTKQPQERYASNVLTTMDPLTKETKYWRLPLNGTPPEPVEFPEGQVLQPRGSAAKPVRAFTRKNGVLTSVLLDPNTNQPIPGSENPNILPPTGMLPRISTGTYHWTDAEGNVHATSESRESNPVFPGASPSGPPAPRTPGAPGSSTPSSSTSSSPLKGDRILGSKMTGPQAKAESAYNDAVRVAAFADGALKNHSATNDKLLASQLIRASEGRFNAKVYDTLIHNAGIANTFNQWLEDARSGELTPEIRQQLVNAAHLLVESANAARRGGVQSSAGPVSDDDILKKLDRLK